MKIKPNKKISKTSVRKDINLPSAKNLLSQWLMIHFGMSELNKDKLVNETLDYILRNSDKKLLMKHKDFSREALERLLHQSTG